MRLVHLEQLFSICRQLLGEIHKVYSYNVLRVVERKKKAVERLEQQLEKLEISMTDKDENKEIALGTSKLNYLDPRISVAW